MLTRQLLVRGMLLGIAAGLLAFLTAHSLGEPQVNKAISFESYVEYTVHHGAPEADLVSRHVQSTIGLATGEQLFSIGFGGLFALVFAMAYGRLGTMTARGTAAVLGLMGFVSIYLVPNLKYPANPPSIGDPDTIGRRTWLYLFMIGVSVLLMVASVILRKRYLQRLGEWNATLVAGAFYVVTVGLAYLLLPGINEVPQQAIPTVVHAVTTGGVTFPPTTLWRFRLASFAIQLTIWATLAVGFGVLAQRLFDRERPKAGALAAPTSS